MALLLGACASAFACATNVPPTAGALNADQVRVEPDAGALPGDAGLVEPDAGPTLPDAGDATWDAGPPVAPTCGSVCPCPDAGLECGIAPLVDLSELCLTPRADVDAEWLAIEARGTFVAEQSVYERVSGDLQAIRAGWPAVQNVHVMPPFDPGLLISSNASRVLADGGVPAFDCLLRTYRGRVTYVFTAIPVVSVDFEGVFDVRRLTSTVLAIPSVTAVEPNILFGDSSDICLVLAGDGGTAQYVFDEAGGDCPAGCTEHHYTGFATEPDGGVSLVGDWTPSGPGSAPVWFTTLPECTKNL